MMFNRTSAEAAAYRLAQKTGVLYRVEHSEQSGMAYVYTENGVNVLLRVPDYCVVEALDFAQRCASQAALKTAHGIEEGSRFGG